MIESNGILGTLMSQSHTLGRSHLTDKQSQHIKETLSKYDPNNLTKADAKEIVSSFREAGLRPLEGLKQAILAERLDAKILVKKVDFCISTPVVQPRRMKVSILVRIS